MTLQTLRRSLRHTQQVRSQSGDPTLAADAALASAATAASVEPGVPATEHDGPPAEPDPTLWARVAARSPAFAASLQRLDPWQRAAATCPEPAVVVRAPVGSGKTAVLAHRVLWLHHALGVPLHAMAVLTFTQRAAAELAERVAGLVDSDVGSKPYALFGTFHSVARTLLAEVLPLGDLGMTRDFSVVDEAAALALLRQACVAADVPAKAILRWQAALRQWQRGGELSKAKLQVALLPQLASAYAQAKRQANAVDFDDLIALCAELAAAADAAVLPRWVLVDELQDCEPAEVSLLASLRRPSTGLFAVGDPDQAIYGWRGSLPGVFEAMADQWHAKVHRLALNYRSTPEVLAAAGAVLGTPAELRVRAQRDPGVLVTVRRHGHGQLEGLWLAARCRQLHSAGVAWNDMAVLARTRRQLADLATVFSGCALPCEPGDTASWWTERLGENAAGPDQSGVRMLTLHGAKGLEFLHVFISGCNQGVSPLASAWRSLQALEEERRLLYVAMTRAKDSLEIGWHAQPPLRGALAMPSQWLLGMPAAAACWPDEALPDRTANADHAIELPVEVAPDCGPWQAGQQVCHPKYGNGSVSRSSGGDVVVNFGKFGEKTFSLVLCPLTAAKEGVFD